MIYVCLNKVPKLEKRKDRNIWRKNSSKVSKIDDRKSTLRFKSSKNKTKQEKQKAKNPQQTKRVNTKKNYTLLKTKDKGKILKADREKNTHFF